MNKIRQDTPTNADLCRAVIVASLLTIAILLCLMFFGKITIA